MERKADLELRDALLRGELCYVFAPRQIGKSSLRVRAEHFLEERGVRCVSIDLTVIGTSDVSVDQWYYGLIDEIARRLGLDDPSAFWERHGRLSPVQRWSRYLRDEVLHRIDARVVVFINAIDAILAVRFPRDDFFASVRAMFNARVDDPAWERLTFCLIGVASPLDLMQDAAQTPFNIGRGIRIEDFTRAEAEGFLPALAGVGLDPHTLIEAVMYWTEGHPYMTQRIFDAILQRAERGGVGPGGAGGVAAEAGGIAAENGGGGTGGDAAENGGGGTGGDAAEAGGPVDLAGAPGEGREPVGAEGGPDEGADARAPAHAPAGDGHSARAAALDPPREAAPAQARGRDRGTHPGRRSGKGPDSETTLSAYDAGPTGASPTTLGGSPPTDPGYARFREQLSKRRVIRTMPEQAIVARVVDEIFLRRGRFEDLTLSVAERYFGKENPSHVASPMLQLYQRLLDGERVRADGDDPVQLALLLTGMVAARREGSSTFLRVRNKIYAAVFDQAWVREKQADRLIAEPLARWLQSGRSVEYVLRGRSLEEARTWAEGRNDLTPDEHAFLLAGLDRSRRDEEVRREEEIERELSIFNQERARAQRRAIQVLAALVAVLLLLLGGFVNKYLEAERERQRAHEAELVAQQARTRVEEAIRAERVAWVKAENARFAEQVAWKRAEEAIAAARKATEGQARAAEAQRELAARLHEAMTALDEARVKAEEAEQVAQGARALSLARTGGRNEALMAGIRAVAPSFRHGRKIPPEAVDGLIEAVLAAGSGITLQGHLREVNTVTFAMKGSRILTSSGDGTARMWDARTGRELSILQSYFRDLTRAVVSPDGSRVVTLSEAGQAWLRDLQTGQQLSPLRVGEETVATIAFSRDGGRLVTASDDEVARIWEASTGRLLLALTGHENWVTDAVFSSDGARVVTGSGDQTVRIWDARSGGQLAKLEGHTGPVNKVAISPDGSRVVSAGRDKLVRLWDGEGRPVAVLEGHTDLITGLNFSPDGTRLLSTGRDGKAFLWEARTGKSLMPLSGHKDRITAAAWSPDGTRIVTSSSDSTARLWDATKGQVIAIFPDHINYVNDAAFSPDGHQVATAGMDRMARIYPASMEAFLTAACRMLAEQPQLEPVREFCDAASTAAANRGM